MATRNDRLQCTWMTSFSSVHIYIAFCLLRRGRNCNVFNLAMENVLTGLPDKIQDQLSRHHTQMHFKSNEMYTLHALLGHPVSENFVSWCQTLKNSSASFLCIQETYRSSPRSHNLKVIKKCVHFTWFEVHLCMMSGQLISDFAR
jgi:hypothetical protein